METNTALALHIPHSLPLQVTWCGFFLKQKGCTTVFVNWEFCWIHWVGSIPKQDLHFSPNVCWVFPIFALAAKGKVIPFQWIFGPWAFASTSCSTQVGLAKTKFPHRKWGEFVWRNDDHPLETYNIYQSSKITGESPTYNLIQFRNFASVTYVNQAIFESNVVHSYHHFTVWLSRFQFLPYSAYSMEALTQQICMNRSWLIFFRIF